MTWIVRVWLFILLYAHIKMHIRHAVYLLIIETNLPIVLSNKLFRFASP